MSDVTLTDRYRGCVFGLASCDALGAAVEFQARGSFEEVVGLRGGGKFDIIPGEWTDDTSMALCVAESLILRGRFDTHDQMARVLSWYERGHLSSNGECFDIGKCTRQALNAWRAATKDGEAITDATPTFFGATTDNANGNGTLMRLCPIPLAYRAVEDTVLAGYARDMSRTTHGGAAAVAACEVYALMIRAALNGEPKAAILNESWRAAVPPAQLPSEVAAVVDARSYATKARDDIEAGGYVVSALEAALWAFHASDTFEAGALLCANLGDDADTIAAIYGTLAGAYYGHPAIPPSWTEQTALRSVLEAIADGLLAFSRCHEAPCCEPEPSEGFQAFHRGLLVCEEATQVTLVRGVRAGPRMFCTWAAYTAAVEELVAACTRAGAPPDLLRDFTRLWERFHHNHTLDHLKGQSAAPAPPKPAPKAPGAGRGGPPPPPPPPPPPGFIAPAASKPAPQDARAALFAGLSSGRAALKKTTTVEKNNLPDLTLKDG